MNTRTPISTVLVAIVGTCLLAACGGQSQGDTATDDDGAIAKVEGAITGGTLVPPETTSWPYAATVLLSAAGANSCSGLKMNASWYLTAAHCVFKSGQALTVTNALVPANGPSYNTTIAQVANHPTTSRGSPFRYDLTLLRLRDTNPIPTWTAGRFAPQVDDAGGRGVGYGCDLAPGSLNGYQKQLADFNTAADPDRHANVYWFDSFANPSLCSGDSGGPFYNVLNGKYYLTGIAQAWGGPDNPFSVWARVSPAREWISAVVADHLFYNNFVDLGVGTFLNMTSSWCAEFYQFGGAGSMTQFPCGLTDDPKQRFWVSLTAGGTEFHWVPDASKCLAVQGASTADGAAVTLLPCDGSANTRWSIEANQPGFPQFRNGNSSKCMVPSDPALFSPITQRTCSNTTDFGWGFVL